MDGTPTDPELHEAGEFDDLTFWVGAFGAVVVLALIGLVVEHWIF